MATNQYAEPEEVGEERARELYQFHRPPNEEFGEAVLLHNADTVVQAHCQLAALRLNVQRAMVCLVDKETQFYVAEATRTLALEDTNDFEAAEDVL